MTPTPSAPLRIFHPEAEPYADWSQKLATLRQQLWTTWRCDSAAQAAASRPTMIRRPAPTERIAIPS
jgi:hypothetical protein